VAFEKFDLSSKTALITGSAGLLGIEHAEALLETGANVVLTDISQGSLTSARIQIAQFFDIKKIITMVRDVTQAAQVREVADKLIKDGYCIDILINNAAIDPKVMGKQGVVETSRLE
jgi:NAD(P)-dependent dehydrogenase (short-subunit alcohol dehydrogenase family)